MNELMRRRRALMAQGGGTVHGTWEDLFYHIDKGDYATAYQQGETISLDLGSTYGVIDMEISNFDYDVLASDTTQKAPVSLVAVQLLNETHRWNPALEGTEPPYTEGTGTIGGWAMSELRAWMIANVLPAIPATVRNRIVEVSKYSQGYTTNGTKNTGLSSNDYIYVPSARECGRNATWDGGRATTYSALDTNGERSKAKTGTTQKTRWWLRSSAYNDASKVYTIPEDGNSSTSTGPQNPEAQLAICLCFCVG